MNPSHHRLLMITASLLLTGASARGDEKPAAEPLELTRLRQQFQHRVDQELVPWREKYRKELQKLEDRLIAERKLVEALAVKKEREASAPLSTDPAVAGGAPGKTPSSAKEAGEMLAGTVWLVYLMEGKKRKALVDTYQFLDGETVFMLSTKRDFMWLFHSASEASIKFTGGDIEMDIDFVKLAGKSKFQENNYELELAARTADSRK